jgi:hypothetical protein
LSYSTVSNSALRAMPTRSLATRTGRAVEQLLVHVGGRALELLPGGAGQLDGGEARGAVQGLERRDGDALARLDRGRDRRSRPPRARRDRRVLHEVGPAGQAALDRLDDAAGDGGVAGLEQGDRALDLAGGEAGEPGGLLLGRTAEPDRLGDQDGAEPGAGHGAGTEGPGDHGGLEQAGAEAVLLLGDHQAEPALLAEGLPQRGRTASPSGSS